MGDEREDAALANAQTVTPAPGTPASGPPVSLGPTTLGVGTVLAGRYCVLRKLGAGGMGVVYAVEDRQRGERVALKTLNQAHGQAIYQLKNEFRTLADLVHDNLVRLHDLMASDGLWFFTMELVHGESFHESLYRGAADTTGGTPLPPVDQQLQALASDKLRRTFSQLAAGVTAIHDAGKLHLDLKPANVLVTLEGRVVILDFGIAQDVRRAAVDVTACEGMSGTPLYMSPEQAKGAAAQPASDWYAVGLMLYEALAGRRPYTGNTAKILYDRQKRDPEPPRSIDDSIPEDLNDLCMALLARDPSERADGSALLLPASGFTARLPSLPHRHEPQLVGRDAELTELQSLIQDVLRGQPRVAFVRGPSGIGKSALVRTFVDRLRSRHEAIVLEGRCYEREAVPYKGFDAVADALSRYLGRQPVEDAAALLPRDVPSLIRLFPALGRVPVVARATGRAPVPDPVESKRRALAALTELLARISDRQPLVVTIDDLQWSDRDSVALLHNLVGGAEPPAILLLGTYRVENEQTSGALVELLGALEAAPRFIDLGALAAAETLALARRLLEGGDNAANTAEAIVSESGGSPFFVEALAHHARSTEREATGVAGMLAARVECLSRDALRLLEVICVFARPVAQSTAAVAAGLPKSSGKAIDELRAAGTVRTGGVDGSDHVAPYHDRIRESVVARLAPQQLALLHARIADVLEDAEHADLEALAIHHLAAGRTERAAGYAERAGLVAFDAMAFDRAARAYSMALELVDHAREHERRLQRALADALKNAGRSAEAASAYQLAAADAHPSERLELQRLAAERLLVCGRIDEGLEAFTVVLDQLGIPNPSSRGRTIASMLARRLRIRLRGLQFEETAASEIDPKERLRIDACASIVAGLTWVDALRGTALQALHLLLALNAGEPRRVAKALIQALVISAMEGGPAKRRTDGLLEQTRALVERDGDPELLGLFTVSAGAQCYLEGRFAEGAELLERAEDILRHQCVGQVFERTNAQLYGLLCLYFLGDTEALLQRLPALVSEARALDDRLTETVLRTRFTHVALLAADEPEAALADVRDAIGRWSHQGFHTEHGFALIGEVESLIYAGQGEAALDLVQARWPQLASSGVLRVLQLARIECLHLRARAALAAASERPPAERQPLLQIARREARSIEREAMHWSTPLALLLQAGEAGAKGDDPGASAALEDAETGLQNAGLGLYALAAQRRRGELIGGDRGRALADEADARMAARQIRDPSRMTRMLAPGFLPRG